VGIGGSIFLIAVGAILAFAVKASVGFISIQVVGWVLMGAGVVGMILTLWLWNSRRRTVVTSREVPLPEQRQRVVEEHQRTEVRDPDLY
jgi:dipeptide/tripeptide permease